MLRGSATRSAGVSLLVGAVVGSGLALSCGGAGDDREQRAEERTAQQPGAIDASGLARSVTAEPVGAEDVALPVELDGHTVHWGEQRYDLSNRSGHEELVRSLGPPDLWAVIDGCGQRPDQHPFVGRGPCARRVRIHVRRDAEFAPLELLLALLGPRFELAPELAVDVGDGVLGALPIEAPPRPREGNHSYQVLLTETGPRVSAGTWGAADRVLSESPACSPLAPIYGEQPATEMGTLQTCLTERFRVEPVRERDAFHLAVSPHARITDVVRAVDAIRAAHAVATGHRRDLAVRLGSERIARMFRDDL